jgi:hypothetical protein
MWSNAVAPTYLSVRCLPNLTIGECNGSDAFGSRGELHAYITGEPLHKLVECCGKRDLTRY